VNNSSDRQTLSIKDNQHQRYNRPSYPKKRVSGASRTLPHDKELKELEKSGQQVVIALMSGGLVDGVIIGSDKFTIKVKTKRGVNSTYFKHSVESFSTVKNQGDDQ